MPTHASTDVIAGVLSRPDLERLREELPRLAEGCVEAITAEVPGYRRAFSGELGRTIEQAVHQALAGFLNLVTSAGSADPAVPMKPSIDGAYLLGRGEATAGRPVDDLLAAYRVGARFAWTDFSAGLVAAGVDAQAMAGFAGVMFAYIDALSASSVAGHSDALAEAGHTHERRRDRLAAALFAGADLDQLDRLAQNASWDPPATLSAVWLPAEAADTVRRALDERTLRVGEEVTGSDQVVLLVPDADGTERRRLVKRLATYPAVIGPARPWHDVRVSVDRAQRAARLGLGEDVIDCEEHLADLTLAADPQLTGDLRRQALEPLAELPPATAERLAETLRLWLLLQGRREEVAERLHVHPQTVRYRMQQLRELYGDRLTDPDQLLRLVLGLSAPETTARP
ncbi:PucR family transcriptional regulator [Calidifontibacter sp. DB0510]|uniref:PucR family transcriptional regulator n=1 Tax=Metallococcus carri TaxID=1656884 RepID=A0A967B2E4_9MICO|nr:helix-turn-helix domain-containing protein [Metallococcus carri]NHN56135.1 PucR family transcriptional regulator [Metallococcus carri]NOP37408.1 helix-turn-helix domain-containing protein [Calidifontibacter sp. DB2511S]